jgi:hypothetical protein
MSRRRDLGVAAVVGKKPPRTRRRPNGKKIDPKWVEGRIHTSLSARDNRLHVFKFICQTKGTTLELNPVFLNTETDDIYLEAVMDPLSHISFSSYQSLFAEEYTCLSILSIWHQNYPPSSSSFSSSSRTEKTIKDKDDEEYSAYSLFKL